MQTLNGFNYADYLKRHFLVGQIDPWRKTERGKKLYTLLTSVQTAMDECKEWSKQDFTKDRFINYLKLNDILVFYSPEGMVEAKEENPKKLKIKRKISEETRKERSERMKLLRNKTEEDKIPSVS